MSELDYNEVFKFMKEFEVDLLNRFNELIIDEPTNTYTIINNCESIEDVELRVVFALCRPIGKGLSKKPAERLLRRFNSYFNTELTREDLRLMYGELCYETMIEEFKNFIKRGFPIDELKA